MEISETLSLPDICVLFWEGDSNLPKDENVNRHLMKMACTDTLWSVQDGETKGGFVGRDCTVNKQVQIHLI